MNLIFTFTLLIVASLSNAISYECPKPSGLGICAITCSSTSCSASTRCCPTACGGSACTTPCKVPTCPSTCRYGVQYVYLSNGCRRCVCAPNPCLATTCPIGKRCVVRQVQCITTPCNPIGVCV